MYHKELAVEQQRLEKMLRPDAADAADEYAVAQQVPSLPRCRSPATAADSRLGQQKKVVEETKAVVPTVRQKLRDAVEGLRVQLVLLHPSLSLALSPSLIDAPSIQQNAPSGEPEANIAAASKAIADGTAVLAPSDGETPK